MLENAHWQARVREVLKGSPVFGKLRDEVFAAFIDSLELRPVAGGTQVIREGDEADSVIIVISGRLRVWRIADDGSYMRYNEIGPGESVGEPGLILRHARTANVTALRDSLLAVLSRTSFERLLTRQPLEINRVFSQSLFNYLRHTVSAQGTHSCKSFAVIPLHPDSDATSVAQNLIDALATHGKAQLVRLASQPDDVPPRADLAEDISHLDALESGNSFLVFTTPPALSDAMLKAVHQSDQVIFVAAACSASRPTELEHQLAAVPGFEMKRKHLVLLHPGNATKPANPLPWHPGRDLERIYPLRDGHTNDFARLARYLTDTAVGVVLGGGGARGFAHIGVLQALEEAGIPIDQLGGNSMGALIGAQYMLGLPLDEIIERTRRFALGGEYPTLPLISLLSGRRMERDLKRMFGTTTIEMLWRPFFAAACNLSQAATTVLDSGLLWRAVLASNSPAGLLPPVVRNGDLLVDGAILDNIPVAAMRARLGTPLEKRHGNGTVIAVDVDIRDELAAPPDTQRLSARETLKAWLGLKARRSPGIGDILYRAGHIGSLQQKARTSTLADRYLAPPVDVFPLMAYRQAEAIVAAGYRHACEEIARWNSR